MHPDEHLVTFLPDGPVLSHEHADAADLTVQASTSDLEVLLYQRPTLGPVQQEGNPAILDAWYEAFTFG